MTHPLNFACTASCCGNIINPFIFCSFSCLILYRLWQSLGYLIVYITGRPNIQKQYVSSWLGLHGFPVGVLSLTESLSADSQAIKKAYLMRLMKEVNYLYVVCFGLSICLESLLWHVEFVPIYS